MNITLAGYGQMLLTSSMTWKDLWNKTHFRGQGLAYWNGSVWSALQPWTLRNGQWYWQPLVDQIGTYNGALLRPYVYGSKEARSMGL